MQCPNCRKVEKGRWLYANGNRSSVDFDLDAWVTEDFYDLSYPELVSIHLMLKIFYLIMSIVASFVLNIFFPMFRIRSLL